MNQHGASCSRLQRARRLLQRETNRLNSAHPHLASNGNPFVNSVGRFWAIPETHHYMRARHSLVDTLLDVNTKEAVQEAYEHVRDILRLGSHDVGIKALVPALFLRM